MNGSILFRMRAEAREAAARSLEDWKAAHDEAMRAYDAEDLVRDVLATRDQDEEFLQRVLQRAGGDDREWIEQANEFIQQYCDINLRIIRLLTELVGVLERRGHTIDGAEKLEAAGHDYLRWKKDCPDLLLLRYGPAKSLLRERIAAALANPPTKSDWRECFEDE